MSNIPEKINNHIIINKNSDKHILKHNLKALKQLVSNSLVQKQLKYCKLLLLLIIIINMGHSTLMLIIRYYILIFFI